MNFSNKGKLALEFVKSINLGSRRASVEQQRQVITALEGALAQTQEPVACAECERLKDALKRANGLAEHFERSWYLRGDEIERLKAQTQEPVAHWSDCAVHSEPAYPKGECDCGGIPPQRTWVNLTVDELIDLEHKHLRHEDLARAIEAKLKEKNT